MPLSNRLVRIFLLASLLLPLAGCQTMKGWFSDDEPETETLPLEALYAEARDARDSGNLSRAETYYNRLIGRFPFGPYTEQAQLDLAYVQYKQGKYEDATSTLDRFVRTYPTHPHIDYAYYLKALVNFGRESFFLQKIGRPDQTRLRERVVNSLKTTFASHYTREVSLAGALSTEAISVYGKQATGEKFLINPSLDATL